MRGHSFDEIKTEPLQFTKALQRMLGILRRPEMRQWRPRMAAALSLTMVAKLFAVGAPVLMGKGIDAVTSGDAALAGLSFVGLMLAYGTARFLSAGLPQLRDAFFTRVTQDANRLIAVEAFAHAQDQSLQFHLTRRAGALARIIERGAAAIDFMLRFLAFTIGPTIIELIIAASVMAALYDLSLAMASVVTVICYAIFTIRVTEWRNRLRRDMNEADTHLRAISMDTLTNFETVKAFAAEKRETVRYNDAVSAYNDKYTRSMQSMNALNAGQEFIMAGGLTAVALIAGAGVVRGDMSAGDITAVLLMLTNIYRPMAILGFAWREIKQGAVDIEKLYELLDHQPDIGDPENSSALISTDGNIRFEDVAFSYEGRSGGLEGLSLDVKGGEFVGIVGPSGAGKSTILKLLFRFYDPDQGNIIIDGQDIKSVSQQSLRMALGLVPQEVVLFNDTLRFNLSYARPDASEAEIIAAAERAQLGDFIKTLPDGLDTRVGERGMKLSGGEKQRVGVARAILLNPTILVLDEATSSLDSETEKEVQTALSEASKGRTTIAIAHRLSTLAEADRIFVLDEGRLVETGNHGSLLKKNGLYANLWRRQTAEGLSV